MGGDHRKEKYPESSDRPSDTDYSTQGEEEKELQRKQMELDKLREDLALKQEEQAKRDARKKRFDEEDGDRRRDSRSPELPVKGLIVTSEVSTGDERVEHGG